MNKREPYCARTPEDEAFDAKYGEQSVRIGGRHTGVLHVGGPELTIEIGGRVYPFEWHSYCGPIPLNSRGASKDLGALQLDGADPC